jgi:hypothetical protein
MAFLAALWPAIILGAVIVFFASSIMHMVLPYHRSDYKRLPDEEKVCAAIRAAGVTRGVYMFPFADHKKMKEPAMQEKFKQGPVGTMIIRQSGAINLAPFLVKWFVFSLVVGFFAAYVAAHTLAPGTDYRQVFRVVGSVAFMAYGLGNLANGIWKGEPWGMVVKEVVDGLIYGLLTAGVFGWLWPK